jgi:hypothetical protein
MCQSGEENNKRRGGPGQWILHWIPIPELCFVCRYLQIWGQVRRRLARGGAWRDSRAETGLRGQAGIAGCSEQGQADWQQALQQQQPGPRLAALDTIERSLCVNVCVAVMSSSLAVAPLVVLYIVLYVLHSPFTEKAPRPGSDQNRK